MDFISKLESRQKGYITGERALDLIKELSMSQGCWGRLLRDLYENDAVEDFKEWVESKKFASDIDLIIALEG